MSDEDDIAKAYAPLVFFHRNERHFPVDPDEFRKGSRFRLSVVADRDQGWDKSKNGGAFVSGNRHGQDFLDVPWIDIVRQSEGMLAAEHASVYASNVRPRDDRNVFRATGRGLFLELEDRSSYQRSTDQLDPSAWPLFYDLYEALGKHMLAYWIFYAYNSYWASDHEGDWEHIRLEFAGRPDRATRPQSIYYAQHNGGTLVSGVPDRQYAPVPAPDYLHPLVYVSRQGHPSEPWVRDGSAYKIEWRSWDGPVLRLDENERSWVSYAGAWGEVGEFGFSTGPLGPRFKRVT